MIKVTKIKRSQGLCTRKDYNKGHRVHELKLSIRKITGLMLLKCHELKRCMIKVIRVYELKTTIVHKVYGLKMCTAEVKGYDTVNATMSLRGIERNPRVFQSHDNGLQHSCTWLCNVMQFSEFLTRWCISDKEN